MSVQSLLDRYKSAKAEQDKWISILDDAYEYAMPQRNTMYATESGQVKGTRVFDSTTERAVLAFANKIQSSLMPPFQKWASFVPGEDIAEENEQAAREVLEEVEEKLFSLIHQSAFDSAINEFLIDLAIGTGCLLVQAGDKRTPLAFQAIPINEVAIEEGVGGLVDAVFRTHKPKARLIKRMWPDAKLSDSLSKLVSDKGETEVELIECSYYDHELSQWVYEVIYAKDKHSLLQRNSKHNPFIVTRWAKVPGEVFGRGEVIRNLADIKTVNKLVELELKNASLSVTGAYTVTSDSGVNPNSMRVVPGAMIPVARNGGPNGPSIAPLPRTGDFQVAEVLREQKMQGIKRSLFDEQLPPQSGAVRSATEIVERMKELANSTTGAFGRMMSELIYPLINRVLEVARDVGEIEAEEFEVDGRMVKVSIISPLAQQQELDEVNAVVRWMELNRALVGEQVTTYAVKAEYFPEWLSEKLSISTELLRDDMDKQEMKQLIAQLVAQMAGPQAAEGGQLEQ